MNLNDYLNPVSLNKPEVSLVPHELSFSRKIFIHTPDSSINNIDSYDIAIIGVPEDKNADIKGSMDAPDYVREKLYQLAGMNRKIRIIDLGNLKTTSNINDTYFGLKDIIQELGSYHIIPIIIGGSQDLTFAMDLAFQPARDYYQLLTFDSRLDMGFKDKSITSRNYLQELLKNKDSKFFNYVNLGHQIYFTPQTTLDSIEKKGFESYRLGPVRSNLADYEPIIRDSSLISIDMNCVRQSEAQGVTMPSPNGFFGHEICRLARYAGSSNHLKALGIFELCPANDSNLHTCHLAAQIIWYFIEGFSLRIKEDPRKGFSKKFIVNLSSISQDIVFYKSLKTERWWMEMPYINPLTSKNHLISCSFNDYQMASNNEIPDRWWKAFHRLA
jgi:formiminoglutamase